MKTKTIWFFLVTLFFLIIGTGCEKAGKEVLEPGLSIYKTQNDYFNNVHTNLMDGEVYYKQSLRGKVVVEDNGDVHYKFRVNLIDGYILADEHSSTAAFLNYTNKEYYEMEIQGFLPSLDEIENSIIDSDPFLEFYYDPTYPRVFEMSDTARINEIIKNGEIEKYFERLK